jgi:soluble lytic murein transglycosylase-like protein
MIRILIVALICAGSCPAQPCPVQHPEAEYYASAYAKHYGLPLDFVRAVIEQESGWHACVVSRKGAVGLMQLMPQTAQRLGVRNRCDVKENISGGIRYLAWLNQRFHGDLRLVAASYYAGEHVIEKRGLGYSNRDVVAYVQNIRAGTEQQKRVRSAANCASRSRKNDESFIDCDVPSRKLCLRTNEGCQGVA